MDVADEKIAATALAMQENAIDGSYALSSFLFGLLTFHASYAVIYFFWGLVSALSPLFILKLFKAKI